MPIRLGAALARCAVMALALEHFFAAPVSGFSGIPPSASIQRLRGVVAGVGAQSSSVSFCKNRPRGGGTLDPTRTKASVALGGSWGVSRARCGALLPMAMATIGREDPSDDDASSWENEIGQWARVTAPAVEVHCISDLHCDYKPNLEWTEALPLPEKNAAGGSRALRVLLLAGDLATDLAILKRCLVGLKMRYDEVVFVPGNHEAWVSRGAEGGQAPDSFAKLGEVLAVCARCGVRTAPLTVELPHSAGASGRVHEVLLLPLLSWYHASWDTEPELPEHETRRLAFEGARPFEQRWADFKFCKWPGISSNWTSLDAAAAGASEALSERFAAVNARWVAEVAAGADGVEREVISFSHFVPRQELLPEKRFLITPELPKVVGSRPLEAQIRAAGATLHCFGHTHLPVDMTLEGVRYIQWSLGMQREAKDGRACAVVKREGPTLVWDSADGAGPYRPTMWGDYYRSNTRNPSETALAPWVLDHAAKARRRMAKLRGEREESESAQGRVEGGGGSHLLRLVRRAWRAVARRRAEEGADEVEAPARDGTPPSRDGRGGETLEQIRVRHYGRER